MTARVTVTGDGHVSVELTAEVTPLGEVYSRGLLREQLDWIVAAATQAVVRAGMEKTVTLPPTGGDR